MGNSWFQFKQFKVEQQGAAMKVGTDGVLVGSWSFIPASGNILDIGSGTGLIALMAAQRSTLAQIDAIEIEESACRQCEENFANSPWSDRCTAIQCSIFDYKPGKRYESILCNPPFFVKSLKNPNKAKTIARHCTDDFDHKQLLSHVTQHLLAPQGRFSLILPTEQAEELIAYANEIDIHVSRVTHVLSFPDKSAVRYLIEFCNNNQSNTQTDQLVLYQSQNIRSSAYNELMKDFYL